MQSPLCFFILWQNRLGAGWQHPTFQAQHNIHLQHSCWWSMLDYRHDHLRDPCLARFASMQAAQSLVSPLS